MNRCLNDCFSYCKGKPDASVEIRDITFTDLGGKLASQKTIVTICHIDFRTCVDCISQSDLMAKLVSRT